MNKLYKISTSDVSAYVVTQAQRVGVDGIGYDCIATYPGFVGKGHTESEAIRALAAAVRITANQIDKFAVIGRSDLLAESAAKLDRAVNSAASARFKVGDRLELTRDCELGEGDTLFVVKHVEGPYMTIQLESDPESRIHTGRDYKYLQLVGQL